jgi:dephospho-CoA kinase
VIGLVGGIGSVKSFLPKELKKNHKVVIVEGDAAGHEVLKEQSVKAALRRNFGDRIFNDAGEVDRRALSELVFGSGPAPTAARAALEAIVHPRITERLSEEINQARSQPGVEFVVLDAAVLLEAGWRTLCDRVIFVEASDEQRLERVAASRGWSSDQLRAREESQFSLERKRKEADDVVDNSQGAEHARSQLEAALSRMDPHTPS